MHQMHIICYAYASNGSGAFFPSHTSPIYPERADQLEEKEYDLNPADDGKSSQESHGASDETQLGLRLDLLVSLDVVKGGRVKKDLH